ncbi:MAG: DUF4834 family protein [Bacteroides sp.]
MHIIAFIFIIIFFLLVVSGLVISTIFRVITRITQGLGIGRAKRNWQERTESQTSHSEEKTNKETQQERKHKKIFTKEDGEYIDFEEIK